MKAYLPYLFILTCVGGLHGQYREISTGTQYAQQTYFKLSDFESTTIPNESWDIVFTAFGLQDGGIHVNESAPLSTDNAPPAIEFYKAPSNDFSDLIEETNIGARLFNTEESWTHGALNNSRDPNNPIDYGWGIYNPGINQVIGNEVFVIKQRDGSLKKFIVDSLVLTTYYLRHADLDGANEVSATVDKADFSDSGLAYFSFTSNSTVDVIPAEWDLVYCRYNVPLDDQQGGYIDYDVTGLLSHPNIKVARVEGIPVVDVSQETSFEFQDRIDIIGSDWKGFSFTSGWFLEDSLSFIVKMPDNQLYKLAFIDFEGSSTGTATFEQTDLGLLSSNRNLAPPGASWAIYPNPITQQTFTLSLDLKNKLESAEVSIFNTLGQRLWTRSLSTQEGLNAYELQIPDTIPTGQYWIRLQSPEGQFTQTLFIR